MTATISTILVTTCLTLGAPDHIGDPKRDCSTFPIQLGRDMTLAQCAGIQGQMAIIETLSHPFFEFHRLVKYECSPGEPT